MVGRTKDAHVITVNVCLPKPMAETIASMAQAEDRSFSNMLYVLAKRGLKVSKEANGN